MKFIKRVKEISIQVGKWLAVTSVLTGAAATIVGAGLQYTGVYDFTYITPVLKETGLRAGEALTIAFSSVGVVGGIKFASIASRMWTDRNKAMLLAVYEKIKEEMDTQSEDNKATRSLVSAVANYQLTMSAKNIKSPALNDEEKAEVLKASETLKSALSKNEVEFDGGDFSEILDKLDTADAGKYLDTGKEFLNRIKGL